MLHTCQIQCCQRSVSFQCLAQFTRSFIADDIAYLFTWHWVLVQNVSLVLHASKVEFCQGCVDLQCFAQFTRSFSADSIVCLIRFRSKSRYHVEHCFVVETHISGSMTPGLCWLSMLRSSNMLLHQKSGWLLGRCSLCHFLILHVLLFMLTFKVQCFQCRVALQCLAQCMHSIIVYHVVCSFFLFISTVCLLSFVLLLLLASQIQYHQCCVDLQCFAQSTCSFCVDSVIWFFVLVLASFQPLAQFCCKHARLSSVNVVLAFNAQLNANAPISSIKFTAFDVLFDLLSLLGSVLLGTSQVQSFQCCVDL